MAHRRSEPRIILGPVLYLRGEQGDRWRLSALFVLDGETEPDDLRVDGVTLPVPPRHVTQWHQRHVWRFDFAIPRSAQDTEATYGFPDGPSWRLIVPARDPLLRFAYLYASATNETATERGAGPGTATNWRSLLQRHQAERFHVLLQGGGQMAGDRLLADCPELAAWRAESARSRASAPLSASLAEAVVSFYFDSYLREWSRPDVAEVLARIPSVMMWGPPDGAPDLASDPQSKVVRSVLMAARRHFTLFQLGAVAEAMPDSVWGTARATFTQGYLLGDVGLLALDLRSDRMSTRVMSDRVWSLLPGWLERFAGARHLLVLSDTPLLFPSTAKLETLAAALPDRLADAASLRDLWRSRGHAEEWKRLVGLLTGFSRRTGCRITVLSGAVGLGGRSLLRGDGVEMWQVMAPFAGRTPPSSWVARGLEHLAARREQPLPGFQLETPGFTEGGRRLIDGRGWVSLAFDGKGQLQARWMIQGDSRAYAQAI